MEDEKLKLLQDTLSKADSKVADIEKALKGKVDVETLKSVNDALENIKETVASFENFEGKGIATYCKGIQEHANKLEADLKAMKESKGVKDLTLVDKVKELVISDKWKQHVEVMKGTKTGANFVIEKAANDLLTTDWTADTGAVGLPQLRIPGVTKHPWKATPIFANVAKRTVGMDHQVSYTEELTRSDAAALKAEGNQYAQSGATWISKVLPFFDFGHFVKVTRESMEDAEYIMQEINDLLYNGLMRHMETLLYGGAGTTTVKGVHTSAKTLAKVLGTKAVTNPSMRDILLAAQLQVSKGINATAATDAGKTGYSANMALIGKAAKYNVVTEKDAIGRPLVESLEAWRPGGMNIMESEDVTESATSQTFVVGDFNKAMLYLKRNLIIETGYDGNDFTYGMITLRASMRGNLLIKSIDEYAFVKGDFETAGGIINQ